MVDQKHPGQPARDHGNGDAAMQGRRYAHARAQEGTGSRDRLNDEAGRIEINQIMERALALIIGTVKKTSPFF